MEFKPYFDTEELENANGANSPTFREEDEYDAINDETFGGELHYPDGDLEEFANRTAGLLLDEPSCFTNASYMPKKSTKFEQIPSPPKVSVILGAITLEELERTHQRSYAEVRAQAGTITPPIVTQCKTQMHASDFSKFISPISCKYTPIVPPDFSVPPPNLLNSQLSQLPLHFPQESYNNEQSSMPVERIPAQWKSSYRGNSQMQNGLVNSNPIHYSPILSPIIGTSNIANVNPQAPSTLNENLGAAWYNRGDAAATRQDCQPQYQQQRAYAPLYQQRAGYQQQQQHRQQQLQPTGQNHYGYGSSQSNDDHISIDNTFSQSPVFQSQQQFHQRDSTMSVIPAANGRQFHRHRNLPSGRTIADFALDPYAGFMSKKEREWLIKIHLIQCMSTGEPLEDDFYYTIWKKRNVLKKQPNKWKIRPRYYSFEDTYPSAAYVPPAFTGSLGKPSHCSAKIPRQLLDLPVECVEDESSKQSQRKLKAMLMRIENAALLLIECDVLKRKISAKALSDDEANEKLNEHMEGMQQLICGSEILPTVMMIQKGRNFLFQLLDFCSVDEMFDIFRTMIATLPKYAKKIPDNSVAEVCKHIYVFLSTLSKEQIIELISLLEPEAGGFDSIKLVFATALALLITLVKSKATLAEITNSLLSQWLCASPARSAKNEEGAIVHNMVITSNIEEMFPLDELFFLKNWLAVEAPHNDDTTTTAEILSDSIEKLLVLCKTGEKAILEENTTLN